VKHFTDLSAAAKIAATGMRPTASARGSHRTVLDEFYRLAFRRRIYRTIIALQVELDA